ncbi:MAG: ABC transporter ATP-binding protein [Roseobacter sp.]
MSVSHRYRNFGVEKNTDNQEAEINSEALEDQKLEAFETGYQAGWDDATKAQNDTQEKISAELGQNLLDLSFTYHEALSKLTMSLEPAMQQILEKLLPEIANKALGPHILEQISALMKQKIKGPVEIVVNPKNFNTVQAMVGDKSSESVVIVGEESLGEGQAFIRIGIEEQQIDLDSIVAEIMQAMTAFFHESAQEIDDGKI